MRLTCLWPMPPSVRSQEGSGLDLVGSIDIKELAVTPGIGSVPPGQPTDSPSALRSYRKDRGIVQ